jgi:uncharacterized membrane protein
VTLLDAGVDEVNYTPLLYGSVPLKSGRKRIQTSIKLIDFTKVVSQVLLWRDFFSQVNLNTIAH